MARPCRERRGARCRQPGGGQGLQRDDRAFIGQGQGDVRNARGAGRFPAAGRFRPPPGIANSSYKNLPAFCRVQVTLTPTSDSDIKVEVWLPASGWNGKLVGIGNGVWAGSISYSEMAPTLAQGYAVVATDTGHKGTGLTAEWAVGHPEKLVDFGHRAIHLMTVTAKAAITGFYGSGPKYSLWNSCSTGGRQGLILAARYPGDYDAISSKAPANPMTDLMTQSMWAGFQPRRTPASALSPALLGIAHKGRDCGVRREGRPCRRPDRAPAGLHLQGHLAHLQAGPDRRMLQCRSGGCAAGHLRRRARRQGQADPPRLAGRQREPDGRAGHGQRAIPGRERLFPPARPWRRQELGLEGDGLRQGDASRARLWRSDARCVAGRPESLLRARRQAAAEPWLDRRADPGEQQHQVP